MRGNGLRTDSALNWPTRAMVWAIWRCRLVTSTAVMVDQGDAADAGAAQVQGHRRAQAACANDQHMGGEQLFLAFDADLVEQDVARIAKQLFVVHGEEENRRHEGGG